MPRPRAQSHFPFPEPQPAPPPKPFYVILGLTSDATAEQIKQAHTKMALKTHPDRAIREQKTATGPVPDYREIRLAYNVLKVPELRALYDRYGKWPVPGYNADGEEIVPEPNPEEAYHTRRPRSHSTPPPAPSPPQPPQPQEKQQRQGRYSSPLVHPNPRHLQDPLPYGSYRVPGGTFTPDQPLYGPSPQEWWHHNLPPPPPLSTFMGGPLHQQHNQFSGHQPPFSHDPTTSLYYGLPPAPFLSNDDSIEMERERRHAEKKRMRAEEREEKERQQREEEDRREEKKREKKREKKMREEYNRMQATGELGYPVNTGPPGPYHTVLHTHPPHPPPFMPMFPPPPPPPPPHHVPMMAPNPPPVYFNLAPPVDFDSRQFRQDHHQASPPVPVVPPPLGYSQLPNLSPPRRRSHPHPTPHPFSSLPLEDDDDYEYDSRRSKRSHSRRREKPPRAWETFIPPTNTYPPTTDWAPQPRGERRGRIVRTGSQSDSD